MSLSSIRFATWGSSSIKPEAAIEVSNAEQSGDCRGTDLSSYSFEPRGAQIHTDSPGPIT